MVHNLQQLGGAHQQGYVFSHLPKNILEVVEVPR